MTGRNRKRVVYIPCRKGGRTVNSNKYVSNMIGILEEDYHVTGELAALPDLLSMLGTKAVFLNWVENGGLDTGMKSKLMAHKLFGAKIIWVFHNKYPHDVIPNKANTRDMDWLARHSNVIMLHSKSSRAYIPNPSKNGKKAVYVPHILYDPHGKKTDTKMLKAEYGIGERDFVYTIFGRIRPYKNIESGIEAFKKMNAANAKLLIAGAPANVRYARKIKGLCEGNSDIILDLQYFPDARLDSLIDISDVILLTHTDKSSMNSGVMIQSFSRGKTVIAPDICMARDLKKYKFFYMYESFPDKAMMKAYTNGKEINKRMGEMARIHMCKNNSREIVKKSIGKILK